MPEPEDSKGLWESVVTTLAGVGAERARHLARLGIHTVGDLLLHRPRRYEDRRHIRAIRDLQEKGPVTVRGRVVACGVKYFRRRTRSVLEVILEDGTGRVHCRWWNMPYLEERYAVGMHLLAHGRVVELKPRTLEHPEVEIVEGAEEGEDGEQAGGGKGSLAPMNRVVPVYPLTEGLTQRWMRARLWALLEEAGAWIEEPWPPVRREGLPSRAEAVRWLHFPPEPGDAERARRRLAFDEFAALQGEIQERRRRLHERARGLPCGGDNRWMRPFLGGLGFGLTGGQTRVLRDIRRDLESGRPMRRLVQGDVGCGKTMVAAAAAIMVLESGFEVALMAPTEILARQHWERLRGWLGQLGIAVDLRTGAVKVEGREGGGRESRSGSAGAVLTVGTHALLTSEFAPERLGLVIIDEQHKFGVAQREALVRKGVYPHLLVLTATPIPRTLALTLYGDLEVSVIDELPPGRGRVRTFVRGRSSVPKVMAFVREQLAAGHQAFVVYPRVEEDEAGMVKAVVRERGRLESALAPFPVGMVHGRLPAEERERVMAAFRGGELRVLLATQIIEVGLDIPEATVMVIENAERFGLAQLHQLRGRIGRGGRDGYCIMVAGHEEEHGMARLRVLETSADGFAIAEADLRMRGPGELLGQAQSGIPPLRFGDLAEDRELLEAARWAVSEWLAGRGPGGANGAGREEGGGVGDGERLVQRPGSR